MDGCHEEEGRAILRPLARVIGTAVMVVQIGGRLRNIILHAGAGILTVVD